MHYWMLLYALYPLFGAIAWRLRGGAWQNFGIFMGTNITRLVTGVLFAIPLVPLLSQPTLVACLLPLGILLGLIMAGWGPYMGMGNHGRSPPSTWIDFFPRMLGCNPVHGVSWDIAGMAFCGFLVFAFCSAAFAMVAAKWALLPLAVLASAGFSACYYLISLISLDSLPILPKLAGKVHEEWSELACGALVAVVLLIMAVIT